MHLLTLNSTTPKGRRRIRKLLGIPSPGVAVGDIHAAAAVEIAFKRERTTKDKAK